MKTKEDIKALDCEAIDKVRAMDLAFQDNPDASLADGIILSWTLAGMLLSYEGDPRMAYLEPIGTLHECALMERLLAAGYPIPPRLVLRLMTERLRAMDKLKAVLASEAGGAAKPEPPEVT